jgi:hypothetical protein
LPLERVVGTVEGMTGPDPALTATGGPASATGIAELDGVLEDLVANARAVLGDGLVGAYLQGSFALGDADGESDCDFVVVTRAHLEESQWAGLRAFHGELPHRPGLWTQHLEGSYAPAPELADLGACGSPWPYVDHGHDTVISHPHCNTEVTRWVLREHGIRLHGPDIRTLVPPVPAEAVRARMVEQVPVAVQAWQEQQRWLAWDVRYSVATMSRMWFSQVHGTVASKKAAMRWVSSTADGAPYAALLEDAAQARNGRWDLPATASQVAAAKAFVRAVGPDRRDQTRLTPPEPAPGPPDPPEPARTRLRPP